MARTGIVWRLMALLLGMLLLTGCQAANARSDRAHADWSRGVNVGSAAINDRVALALDAAGANVYLVWVTEHERNGAEFLRYAHLDRAGKLLDEHDLRIGADQPSELTLVADSAGSLHLFWKDRLAGVRRLFYAQLDGAGELISYPEAISLPDLLVASYAAGLNNANALEVFWSVQEGQGAGLYHTRLDLQGRVIAENLHLGQTGYDPAFRVDRQGQIHLVWQDEPAYGEHAIRYATFDPATRAFDPTGALANFPISTGLIGHRPIIGLAGDRVYIFWSIERRGGGLTPPMAESYYVTFPLGQPEAAGKAKRVHIPATNRPEYERSASLFALRELASPAQSQRASQFVYLPSTVQGQPGELAAAFSVQVSGRISEITQVVLTIWRDGELAGYQIAGKTRNLSLKPTLLADANQDLHVAWIDNAGFGAFDVFYASTAREARAHLNRLTGQDALAALFDLGWGLVQALGFLPMVLAWMFMPLALLAVYVFVRAEGDMAEMGTRLVFAAATLLYAGFKYLFRPNWLAALPLPQRLPSDIANVLVYVMPFVITGVAGLLTWLYVRKRDYTPVLAAFGVFAGADALLTLLIYVPGVLAD